MDGPEGFDGFGGVCGDSGGTEVFFLRIVRKCFWRIWKGLGVDLCGFGKI